MQSSGGLGAVFCAGFDMVEGGLLECVKGMGWLKHISAIYCGYREQRHCCGRRT